MRFDQDVLALFGAADTPDELPTHAPAAEPSPVPVASPVRAPVFESVPLPAALVSPLLPVAAPAPEPVPEPATPPADASTTDAIAALATIAAASPTPPAPVPFPSATSTSVAADSEPKLAPAEDATKEAKKHRHHKKDKRDKEAKKKESHHKHGHKHKKRHSSASDSESASSASSSSSTPRKHRKHRSHRKHRRRSDSSSSSSSEPSSEDVDEVAREAEEFKRIADARSRAPKSAAAIFDPERAEKQRKADRAHSTEAKMTVIAEQHAREAALEATNAKGRPPVRDAARVVHGLVKKITTLQRTDAVLSKRMAEGTYAPGASSAHPHGGRAPDEGSGDEINSEDSFASKSAEDSDEGEGSSIGSFIASDEDDLERAIANAHSSAESDDEGKDSKEKSKKDKRKEKRAAKAKAEHEAAMAVLAPAQTPAPIAASAAPLDVAVLDAEPVGFRDTEMGRLSEHYQVKISSLFAVSTGEAEVVAKPESEALARYLHSLKRDAKGLTSFDLNSAHVASSHAYALASLDQHLRTSVVKGLVHAQAQLNIPGFPGKPTLPSNPAQRSFAEEVASSIATTLEPDTKRILTSIWDAVREGREAAALLYRDLMNAHSVTLLAIRPMVETPDRQICPLSGTKIEPGEPVALLQIVRHGPWEEDAPDHDKSWFSARPWEDPSLLTHTGIIIVRATIADKAPPLFVRKQKRQEEPPAPPPVPSPLAVPQAVAPPPQASETEPPMAKRARLDPVVAAPSPPPAATPMGVNDAMVLAPPVPPAAHENEAAKRKREGAESDERSAKRARTEAGAVPVQLPSVAPQSHPFLPVHVGTAAPAGPRATEYLSLAPGSPPEFDGELCVELGGLWRTLTEARDKELAAHRAPPSDNPFFDAMDDTPPPPSDLEKRASNFANVATQADLKRALQAADVAQDMNYIMAVVKLLVVPAPGPAPAAHSTGFDFTDLDSLYDPPPAAPAFVYRTLPGFNQRLLALLVGIRQRVDKAQAARGAPTATVADHAMLLVHSPAGLNMLSDGKRRSAPGVLTVFLAIFGVGGLQ
jgi:hypothetical protein